ncbi:MAG: PQQ-binding-like beta-propeller repeat protein [Planctomycetota bacterium]
MLRCALVVGIAGWLGAQAPAPTPTVPTQPTPQSPSAAPTPRAQAEQFVRELAEPGKQNAAVKGLVALGDAAVPALHKALTDRRSDVLQWALFACSGLQGESASLRAPVERLLASKDLGVALMARRAWPAVDGRSGLLLTLGNGDIVLVTHDAEKVLCTLQQVFHTELLPNGNLLVASHSLRSVREVGSDGSELWAQGDIVAAVDCERLPGGSTLLCSYTGRRVSELGPNGDSVWSTETNGMPFDADRLANGNTLITQYDTGGVIEVDRNGKTVWSFDGTNLTSAARQLDGSTLVTNMDTGHVTLVEPDGKSPRTWRCHQPMQAELLPDGHLVVNERQAVCILDADGKDLWRLERANILCMQLLGAGPLRANKAPVSESRPTDASPKK